ncbi:MAG: hypothetical protein K5647_00480 [Clostridiales bacterium]|nr:hypothetical protein [Clostridiales bacterium]
MSRRCYSGDPPKWSKAVVIGLAVLGVGLFFTGYAVQSWKGMWQTAGAAAAVASLLLSFRMLTSYIYEISDDERPGEYDLVITEVRGKKNRTVCRVSAGKGRFMKPAKGEKLPDVPGPRCDFTVWGADPDSVCVFLPSEEEGGGIVKFAPDREMAAMLAALCGEDPGVN